MAIYHCSIKIGSRSRGKSAVAAAAYRAADKLKEQETGLTHDYTKKQGVIYQEILLPEHAPKEYSDRETLWNAVQSIEKQKNAQLFREIEVALPKEISRSQQIDIVRQYVSEQFVNEGMCVDFAIHDKRDGNPHVHIMLTTRPIKNNGAWGVKEKKGYKLDENGEKIPVIDPETGKQKVRVRKGKGEEKLWVRETVQANDWNNQSKAEIWREAWANQCNQVLTLDQQINHRSYERQGIELEPTKHVGVVQYHMKKKGKSLEYDKAAINAEIIARNQFMQQIREVMRQLYEKMKERVRMLYERISATARDFGYVRTTGELINDSGTTRRRDRTTHERMRGLESLVRETKEHYQYASETDREIEGISQTIKEKEEEIHARIAQVFARRSSAIARRSSDGERDSLAKEPRTTADDFKARADRALSNRKNRDLERERQAIEALKEREAELRREKARARERSFKYGGPRL